MHKPHVLSFALAAFFASSAAAQTPFDEVHSVFRMYCADCHSTQGNGALNIAAGEIGTAYAESQLLSYFSPGQTKGFAALVRIQNGDMPLGAGCTGNPSLDAPNAACLTASDQARIQAWLQDGQLGPLPTTGQSFCFGNGTGTLCPCGNTGGADGGCANTVSFGGGKLTGAGVARIGADTLVLRGTRMPNSAALYFQGTDRVAAGAGQVLGDGLRCVTGGIQRLSTETNYAGASQYPEGPELKISIRGAVTVPGSTRHYQVWYRNAANFCTPSTFNLTNGLTVNWGA